MEIVLGIVQPLLFIGYVLWTIKQQKKNFEMFRKSLEDTSRAYYESIPSRETIRMWVTAEVTKLKLDELKKLEKEMKDELHNIPSDLHDSPDVSLDDKPNDTELPEILPGDR